MLYLISLALAAAQPATAVQIGITAPAPQTITGNPATFDLGGFRLGMSEADVDAVTKARGMKVQRAMRVTTFEDNVRGLVRGSQLAMKGGSVRGKRISTTARVSGSCCGLSLGLWRARAQHRLPAARRHQPGGMALAADGQVQVRGYR
jgi:hypothetical protein